MAQLDESILELNIEKEIELACHEENRKKIHTQMTSNCARYLSRRYWIQWSINDLQKKSTLPGTNEYTSAYIQEFKRHAYIHKTAKAAVSTTTFQDERKKKQIYYVPAIWNKFWLYEKFVQWMTFCLILKQQYATFPIFFMTS